MDERKSKIYVFKSLEMTLKNNIHSTLVFICVFIEPSDKIKQTNKIKYEFEYISFKLFPLTLKGFKYKMSTILMPLMSAFKVDHKCIAEVGE